MDKEMNLKANPKKVAGGKKAVANIKKAYGADFYQKIGAMGGRKSKGGGFSVLSRQQVQEIGRRGGKATARKGMR